MNKTAILLSVACCLAALSCRADAVNVPRTPTPIDVDGHFLHLHPQDKGLGEPAWKKAARIEGLPHTAVHALHDDNFLYLGFLCSGEEQGEAKGEVRTRDNTSMWRDSCVEIFLDVKDRKYQFIITHVGAVSDLMNADTRFDFDIRAHALWDTWDWKNWYLEVALPIAEIDPDRQSQTWKFNICRTLWRNGKMRSVSLVPRGEYQTLFFAGSYGGDRRFALVPPNVEIAPGMHRGRLVVRNPGKDKGRLTIVAETEAPSGMTRRRVTALHLEGTSSETVDFTYIFSDAEGRHRLTVRLVDDSGVIRASTTRWYDMRRASAATAFLDSSTYFSDAKEATLTLNMDSRELGGSPDEVRLDIRVVRFGTNTPLINLNRIGKRGRETIRLPLDNLPPGPYQVITKLLNPTTGEVLDRFENRFTKSRYAF